MSDMEKAVEGGAEFIAAQQAQASQAAAAEAARVAGLAEPLDVSDAGLISRGVAIAADMTSPGGPWHGLPADAATDPSSVDWQENCRWACVEGGQGGSFFVATFDGTTTVGDHAENVRGYAHQSKAGHANWQAHPIEGPERLTYALNIGNGVAYGGADPNFYVAEFADAE